MDGEGSHPDGLKRRCDERLYSGEPAWDERRWIIAVLEESEEHGVIGLRDRLFVPQVFVSYLREHLIHSPLSMFRIIDRTLFEKQLAG